jgi:hypothetical protein
VSVDLVPPRDFVSSKLDNTVTAQWRRRLAGVRPEERRHWRTKTAYYAAVNRLLAAGVPQPSWSDVTDAVRPKGSRSTFYEVTGVHAKHPLVRDLLAHEGIDSMQLALYYRRANAVDQLIDETKVWTYWPYREFLSMRYRIDPGLDARVSDARVSVEMLASMVGAWARRNPSLAAALGHAPPVCAVEDLLVLRPGQFSAVHAVRTLTRVVKDATGGATGS